jgi:peptidoglycan/xylan/chitin deacetylase (PgdA/CDA1 family)
MWRRPNPDPATQPATDFLEAAVVANSHRGSHLVISLDFELMWGMRDQITVESYGANVRGVREAIPRLLDLFERFRIRATWATVGFLFCETKDELLASLPALQPSYRDAPLSNYRYVDEIGSSEADDPHYFGFSLLKRIQGCPDQEIATHTFSHYYCLEEGQTSGQFRADLDAAFSVARRQGVPLKSIVFPRNQYAPEHLEIAADAGLKTFRGNERSWLYRPARGEAQSALRRAGRLADQYVNITGHHAQKPKRTGELTEVAASRFLRPHARALAPLDTLRLTRIRRAIDAAAAEDRIFHLWWHPHNFGVSLEDNMAFLTAILGHFARARHAHGMRSSRMDDFA